MTAADEEVGQIGLASQLSVFAGALCVMCDGEPLSVPDQNVFVAALEREQVPERERHVLQLTAARGVRAIELPPNPYFNRDQARFYVAALTMFAFRLRGEGRLAAAMAVAASYRINASTVRSLVREMSIHLPPKDDALATQLEEYLDPPPILNSIAGRVFQLSTLERSPRSIARISPTRVQHPLDRDTMAMVKEFSGFDDIARLVIEKTVEPRERVFNLGSRIRVGPTQFGQLYDVFRDVVRRTGVDPIPELFVESGSLNAYTTGYERPFIVLGSATVSLCTRDEMEFILAHEIGHIRFEHQLYHMAAESLPLLVEQMPVVGPFASFAVREALQAWHRASELSSDRFGLLAVQDLEVALRVMMKLAGAPPVYYRQLNVDAFVAQRKDFGELSDVMSLLTKAEAAGQMSHPWLVVRAAELKDFHDSGAYAQLLNGIGPERGHSESVFRPPPLALPFACPLCSARVAAHEGICRECGAPCRESDRMQSCSACRAPVPPFDRFCEACGVATERNPEALT